MAGKLVLHEVLGGGWTHGIRRTMGAPEVLPI
jgi:hypothetical protein